MASAGKIVVYELHKLHGGKWQISSLFDDRHSALAEAHKLEQSAEFAGIRVVEEQYDELSKQSETRTIFKTARDEPADAGKDFERQEAEGRARRHDARLIERVIRARDREWRNWLFQIFMLSVGVAGSALGLLWLLGKILVKPTG